MSFPRYPKYKDSGVEWLGEVPEHWEARRLKHISPFIAVGIVVNPSTFVTAEGLPFIYGGDIREGVIDWQNARRIAADDSEGTDAFLLRLNLQLEFERFPQQPEVFWTSEPWRKMASLIQPNVAKRDALQPAEIDVHGWSMLANSMR